MIMRQPVAAKVTSRLTLMFAGIILMTLLVGFGIRALALLFP